MQPITSSTAIGSLMPDSPSSVRASLRRSVEPRSTANTAAASVAATVDPSSSASFASRSNRALAATAVSAAVTIVPSVASMIDVSSTGRISSKPADRPPSKRMKASATTPTWRASSKSREVDQLQAVGPDQHPDAEHQHEAGHPQAPSGQRGADARDQQRADARASCPMSTPRKPTAP